MAPPKSNRTKAINCDAEKYRRRHRVENFFCRIKHFRRFATSAQYRRRRRVRSASVTAADVVLQLANRLGLLVDDLREQIA